MLELKLNHVSKRGQCSVSSTGPTHPTANLPWDEYSPILLVNSCLKLQLDIWENSLPLYNLDVLINVKTTHMFDMGVNYESKAYTIFDITDKLVCIVNKSNNK